MRKTEAALVILFFLWLPPATEQQRFQIQTDSASDPAFSMRCSLLATVKSCAPDAQKVTVEAIEITFSDSNVRATLCATALDASVGDTQRLVNYFENECPSLEAETNPFRVPVQNYLRAYTSNCMANFPSYIPKAFTMVVMIKCIPALLTPTQTSGSTTGRVITVSMTPNALPSTAKPTPEPTTPVLSSISSSTPSTPTASQRTSPTTHPSSRAVPVVTGSDQDITSQEPTLQEPPSIKPTDRSSTKPPGTGSDEIAGLPRDTFIAVICVAAFVFLAALVIVGVLMHRSRTQPPYKKTYASQNGGPHYLGHNGLYLTHMRSGANGSIAPSTVGDFDSIRNVRSPSLTPSLLVPVGAESLVSMNINGEKQSFVAVPVNEAARALGRSASASDIFDAGSILSSSASDVASGNGGGGGSQYRSLFSRRRSGPMTPNESAADNRAFAPDPEARGVRRARTATASSGGRLESIGEELSVDSERADEGRRRRASATPQQPPPARDQRLLDRYVADAERRLAATAGALPARRMTLPAKPASYYDASTASATQQQQRYSADGRSFTYEGSEAADDYDDNDGSISTSATDGGEPHRWPYSSRVRLPRTSWTGAGTPSAAFPVKKQGWISRPPRRQSAL